MRRSNWIRLMLPSYFLMISAARWSEPGVLGMWAIKKNFFTGIHRFVYTRIPYSPIYIMVGTIRRYPYQNHEKNPVNAGENPYDNPDEECSGKESHRCNGDFAGVGIDAGAATVSGVTAAAGTADTCTGAVPVVTGTVPSSGTTEITVPNGTFREGLLTVTLYCPGSISTWKL